MQKKTAIFGWQYSPTSAAEIASVSPSPSFNKIEWRQCLTMLRCNCVSVKWLTSVSICCCWKVVWSMCEQIRVIHFPQQRRFVLSFSFSTSTFNAFRASLFACFACFTSLFRRLEFYFNFLAPSNWMLELKQQQLLPHETWSIRWS